MLCQTTLTFSSWMKGCAVWALICSLIVLRSHQRRHDSITLQQPLKFLNGEFTLCSLWFQLRNVDDIILPPSTRKKNTFSQCICDMYTSDSEHNRQPKVAQSVPGVFACIPADLSALQVPLLGIQPLLRARRRQLCRGLCGRTELGRLPAPCHAYTRRSMFELAGVSRS